MKKRTRLADRRLPVYTKGEELVNTLSHGLGVPLAIAALVLAPFFLYFHKWIFHSREKAIGCFLFAVYLSGMFAVAGLPDIRYIRFEANVNLVPFQYMFSDYENSLLNVLLFVPLGCFLPLLWQKFKPFYRTVFFGLGVSLLIEVLQIFTYRATDVNDLMTNTAGACVGFLIYFLLSKILPANLKKQFQSRKVNAMVEVFFFAICTFVIMVTAQTWFVHSVLNIP